jgi:hypothetical protein
MCGISARAAGASGAPAGEATSSVDSAATTHVVTDRGLGEFDVDLTLDPPDPGRRPRHHDGRLTHARPGLPESVRRAGADAGIRHPGNAGIRRKPFPPNVILP